MEIKLLFSNSKIIMLHNYYGARNRFYCISRVFFKLKISGSNRIFLDRHKPHERFRRFSFFLSAVSRGRRSQIFGPRNQIFGSRSHLNIFGLSRYTRVNFKTCLMSTRVHVWQPTNKQQTLCSVCYFFEMNGARRIYFVSFLVTTLAQTNWI